MSLVFGADVFGCLGSFIPCDRWSLISRRLPSAYSSSLLRLSFNEALMLSVLHIGNTLQHGLPTELGTDERYGSRRCLLLGHPYFCLTMLGWRLPRRTPCFAEALARSFPSCSPLASNLYFDLLYKGVCSQKKTHWVFCNALICKFANINRLKTHINYFKK